LRALGASFGLGQDYSGPMAKQHRMFVLTVGSVLGAFLPLYSVLMIALIVIVLGCVITIVRRAAHIISKLSHPVS
jgi:phosphatidylglycerophosphate synthase